MLLWWQHLHIPMATHNQHKAAESLSVAKLFIAQCVAAMHALTAFGYVRTAWLAMLSSVSDENFRLQSILRPALVPWCKLARRPERARVCTGALLGCECLPGEINTAKPATVRGCQQPHQENQREKRPRSFHHHMSSSLASCRSG